MRRGWRGGAGSLRIMYGIGHQNVIFYRSHDSSQGPDLYVCLTATSEKAGSGRAFRLWAAASPDLAYAPDAGQPTAVSIVPGRRTAACRISAGAAHYRRDHRR